ncbi:MAG: hypothetical protein ACI4MH_02785 [Candidatus Coproplasma sp.]
MSRFNYLGLIFVAAIMVPNIVYAILHKGNYEKQYKNAILEVFEQIGRFGCMVFMIISPPYLCYGYWFNNAKTVYILLNSALTLLYVLGWIIFNKNHKTLKYLALSILPSAIFISSGVILANYPLIILSLIFAISHITISYKSSKL